MATRKRTSKRSGLVGRAVRAGRQALREAERRVPPDLRRQVERRLKDADKTARAAIKQLQVQAKKASTRADVNTVLKRIDGLTKQARQIVAGSRSRACARVLPCSFSTQPASLRLRYWSTAPGVIGGAPGGFSPERFRLHLRSARMTGPHSALPSISRTATWRTCTRNDSITGSSASALRRSAA